MRERFVARYPRWEAFDAWAFKELLALNPDVPVQGIDDLPAPAEIPTVGAVLRLGARLPDDDRRNQDRFAHDASRKVRIDRWGRPLPADPRQLDMGPRRGSASQAHAHYGLPQAAKSGDTEVLKKTPHLWAYPPEARAFGPEFAQLHTDLAIVAATGDTPGSETLGWLLLAGGHHYLQDLANQIHTLQAIYGFFFDAKLESYLEELRSLGGLLRSRDDFVDIGIDIIASHHALAETLFAKRVDEILAGRATHPAVSDAVDAIAHGDAELEKALDGLGLAPSAPFGQAIAQVVIERSAPEGGEVYALIRDLAQRKYSKAGITYDASMDPDAALRPEPHARKLERFYALQQAGFARAGSALRRHVALYQEALGPPGSETRAAARAQAARRLVATQLAYLDERDALMAAWEPPPPHAETINWLVPGALLLFVAGSTGLIVWLVRRRIRRRPAA